MSNQRTLPADSIDPPGEPTGRDDPSGAMLTAILDSATDYAIVALDRDGRITRWSAGAVGLLGWGVAEAVGRSWRLIFTPEDLAAGEPEARIASARADGPTRRDRWFPRKDGSRFWGSGTLTPTRDLAGGLTGYVNVLGDRIDRHVEQLRLEARAEVLESIADAFYAIDRDGRLTYVNRRAAELWGRPPDELLGRELRELLPDLAVEGSLAAEAHARAAREGRPTRAEFESAALGTWVAIDVYPAAAGGLSVHLRDVAGRKRAEAELIQRTARVEILADAASRLISGDDPDEVVARLFRAVVERLGVDACLGFAVNETGRALRLENHLGVPTAVAQHIRADFDQTLCGTVARTRRPAYVPDLQASDDRRTGYIRELGLRSYASFPVATGERLFGTLAFGSRDRDRFATADLAFFLAVSHHVAAVRERRRAEEEVRASEARFRAVADLVPDLLWRSDPNGHAGWHNQRWLEYTGQSGEAARGHGWLEVVHPDDREAFLASWQGALASGRPFRQEHRLRGADGLHRWFLVQSRPLRDEAAAGGAILQWFGAATDIHEQRTALEALRESEGRFRRFAEHSADVLWIVDAPTLRLEYLSPAYERIWGEPREAVTADLAHWAARVHPDDRAEAAQALPRLLAGEAAVKEYRIVRPGEGGGEVRWIRDTGFPIPEPDGAVRRLGGIARDVTDERRGEERLRASRRQFRTLAEGIPHLLWRARGAGDWTWASPQWTRYTGLTDEESRGDGWLAAVHPGDREATAAAWDVALDRGGLDVEHRLREAATGDYRWFQTRSTPVRDEADGRIEEWLGTSTDIHETHRLQDRQRVLLAELQHRTRNLLAVVRAIARQTEAGGGSLEDFGERFAGRLAALSRVQGLLSRADDRAGTIRDLVAQELAAHGAVAGARVTIDGPPVGLPPAGVQTLALALHELATNALKHGALATPSGRLAVTWRVKPASNGDGSSHGAGGRPHRLELAWREGGVAVPAGAARRRGYGRELIERALPYELDASTRLEFGPDGVSCLIELPLAAERPGRAEPP